METAFQATAVDQTRYVRTGRIYRPVKGPLAPHVEADIVMKDKVLTQLEAPDTTMRRFLAPDSLMWFLQTPKLCKERAGF